MGCTGTPLIARARALGHTLSRLVSLTGPPQAITVYTVTLAVLLSTILYGLALWRPRQQDYIQLQSALTRPTVNTHMQTDCICYCSAVSSTALGSPYSQVLCTWNTAHSVCDAGHHASIIQTVTHTATQPTPTHWHSHTRDVTAPSISSANRSMTNTHPP